MEGIEGRGERMKRMMQVLMSAYQSPSYHTVTENLLFQ